MISKVFIVSWVLFLVVDFQATAQNMEEFNGPFASWANVKSRFGATGNGKTDDTQSLQAALDSLSNTLTAFNTGDRGYMVVYLPAGTYRISRTLSLRGKIGVSIIGEDPENTVINWAGGNNDTMLWANGSAYFKIARVSWNGGKSTGVEAIGIHWKNRWDDGKSKSNAPLNIELSDMNFDNLLVGICGGTFNDANGTGNNDSEFTIRRCTFRKCEVGLRITGFNALDYWVWNCSFINCRVGVFCVNGNYHAYKCYFEGSTDADFQNKGGYYTSVRECYSYGSKIFSLDEGSSCNPFKRIFQKNTIINYRDNPIQYFHLGSVSLVDNSFIAPATKAHYDVMLGSWCLGIYTVLSFNNRYQVSRPIYMVMPQQKVMRIGDAPSKGLIATNRSFTAAMPKAAKRQARKVFEVPPGANSAAIQQLVNAAARLKGSKPIIHFGFGRYAIDKTIDIPAGADMQLTGDGLLYATQLLFANARRTDNNPVFRIKGPSSVVIRDMQIGLHTGNYNNNYVGIVFENIDRPGSRMMIDQLHSSSNNTLFLDGMNYLYVEKNNSFFSEGNYLSGGAIQQAGKGTFKVNCFGGQYARLTVRNNAEFTAKDCWWEGPVRLPLDLTGDGNITIDGAKIAPNNADSLPTIRINKFDGKIILLNMYVQGGLNVNPNNDKLKLLCYNLHFYHKMDPLSFLRNRPTFQGMFMGIHSQCFDNNNPACKAIASHPAADVNVKDTTAFIRDMLTQSRQLPVAAGAASPQVSNIYITRLSVGAFKSAIEVINR